nr:hypothetical protein [uncultured Holophaga sp.]
MLHGQEGHHFHGCLQVASDRAAATTLATACPVYRVDDENETPLDGEQSCFNCRYRRWRADGFTCMKGFPSRTGAGA